ncbi:MAG: hypothetical protein CGW95_01515 [Phenylobacterium zucineum]|nr:MAG: hypothetical protein CGW95_01515 [Phenylobacterium zucineum]
MMDAAIVGELIAFLGLAGGVLSVWVSLRERLVRAETKIEILERLHGDQRSDVQALRDWLNDQFSELRKSLDRKADR